MYPKFYTMSFIPSKYQVAIDDFIIKGSGNAVVAAVAGSGKTTTLVNVMKLIPETKRILFLAFNKSIQLELAKKVPNTPNIAVKTVHGFGMSALLKEFKCDVQSNKYRTMLRSIFDYHNNGYLSTIAAYDFKGLQLQYIDTMRICEYERIENMVGYTNRILTLCDLGRLNLVNVNDYERGIIELSDIANKHNVEVINGEVSKAWYLIKLGSYVTSQIDFTDMVYLPLVLNLNVFQSDFVFVDECQDLNAAQRTLMLKAVKRNTGRFIAVGDEQQAIYGFAGADADSFQKLCAIPNTITLPLSVCYRCGTNIINMAKGIVPQIEACDTAKEGIIEYNFSHADIKSGDMVLCRQTFPLVALCLKYLSQGIKAYVMGSEIGRSLAKMIEETKQSDMQLVFNCLYKEREKIVNNVMRKENLLQSEAEESNTVRLYTEKIEVIELLAKGIAEPMIVINKINSIFSDENAEGICLSTIHKSKGLEADRVFIIHSELMPSKYARKDWERKQESNLIYVAYTRAKSVLGFVTDFDAYSDKSNTPRADIKQSEFQGTIGAKLPLELEITKLTTIMDKTYGETTIFTMKDSEGNMYSKFGKITERFIISNHSEVKEGTIVKFSGTVKGHRPYMGVNYTIISNIAKYK